MKYLIVILLLSCNTYQVTIDKVVDGDSFYASGKEYRLWGVDCPENTSGHNQPFGKEATEFTRSLTEHSRVRLITKDHDKYGREVDIVLLQDGRDLSMLLVQAGLAWTYKKYSPIAYQVEEEKARDNHIGLWSQDHPEPPYVFRKRNR